MIDETINIIRFDEIDSTNDEAKRILRVIERGSADGFRDHDRSSLFGTVIIASRQTAGRGRLGRGFVSPGFGSIYASFILPPPECPAEQLITALAAVAVCEALEKETCYKPGIKWVNDILVDGKKVCGILAESVPGAVVLGIGININLDTDGDHIPEDLRGKAGSLQLDAEKKALVESALIDAVFRCVTAEDHEAAVLMGKYRERSVLLGKKIVLSKGGWERIAIANSIADDGALVVEYDDGSFEALCSIETGVRFE